MNIGFMNVLMYNPVIVDKSEPYDTEEGCLSLTGVRSTKRYENIEVEYEDANWNKNRQKFKGWHIFYMANVGAIYNFFILR